MHCLTRAHVYGTIAESGGAQGPLAGLAGAVLTHGPMVSTWGAVWAGCCVNEACKRSLASLAAEANPEAGVVEEGTRPRLSRRGSVCLHSKLKKC